MRSGASKDLAALNVTEFGPGVSRSLNEHVILHSQNPANQHISNTRPENDSYLLSIWECLLGIIICA